MEQRGTQQPPSLGGLLSAARGTGLRTVAMAVKIVELKRIAYDCALVPSEGSEVCCELAAPAKHSNKDPAGHAFHAFALRQAGHVGEFYSRQISCVRHRRLIVLYPAVGHLSLHLLPEISCTAPAYCIIEACDTCVHLTFVSSLLAVQHMWCDILFLFANLPVCKLAWLCWWHSLQETYTSCMLLFHVDEVVEEEDPIDGPDRPSTPSADEFYSAR